MSQRLFCTVMFTAAAVLNLCVNAVHANVVIDTVPVGNPGNAPDTRYTTPGYGAVGYAYNIGKYEVTNAQYAEFLNAVAYADPYNLYNMSMGSGYGGITRSGSSPNYSYTAIQGRENKPVNYVNYWDSCRFTNWLHNGQQGAGTTETGAYTLNGYNGTDGRAIQRNPGSKWAVTSEDEWYKAAYYKAGSTNAGYWDYPTQSNTTPTAEGPAGTDLINGSANYGSAVGDLTNVGSYTAKPSDSAYGTFDQGGNVWEWNELTVYQGSPYSYRGLRGGSFNYDIVYLRASNRNIGNPANELNDFGFRVSEVPEPGTLGLFVCGLVMLRRR